MTWFGHGPTWGVSRRELTIVLARAARSAAVLATPPVEMHEVVLATPACPFS